MAKSKKRARDRGVVRFVGVEVDPPLDQAIEDCAAKERRTKRAVIILAIEEYLAKQGLWPPQVNL